MGQATGSAPIFRPIQAVNDDCETQLKVALERLDKTLDAYEKATKALQASLDQNAAQKSLDVLKDQLIAVKDLIIAEQDKLITRLQKTTIKSKLRQILEVVEKIVLFGAGVYLGRL